MLRYYDGIRSAVRDALAAGWSEERAMEEIDLPEFSDWGQYEAWFPLNVQAVYRWMAGM